MPLPGESLILEIADGIASVVINREHRLNALDDATVRHFQDIVARAKREGVGALVITGAGTKAFCAGDDLKALAHHPPSMTPSMSNSWLEFTDQIEEFPAPVIAAIEGYCLGGGLELALACDLRIAGSDATLGLPEMQLNALPTGGATFRLPRVVGIGRAREMIMFGRKLDAREALAWGLVAEVVPRGGAFQRAKEMAAAIGDLDRQALARAKAMVTFSYAVPSATGRYLAYLADVIQLESDAFKAGVSGFANRRSNTPDSS